MAGQRVRSPYPPRATPDPCRAKKFPMGTPFHPITCGYPNGTAIDAAMLAILIAPFAANGTTRLYFSRRADRVYVGQVLARRFRDAEGEPVNLERDIPLSPSALEELARDLNGLP